MIVLYPLSSLSEEHSDNVSPPDSHKWKTHITKHFILYYIPAKEDDFHGAFDEEITCEGRYLEESYYDAINLGFPVDEHYLKRHDFEPFIVSLPGQVYKNKIHVYIFNFNREYIYAYTGSIGDPEKKGERMGSYIYLNTVPCSYMYRNSDMYLSLMKSTLRHEYFHVIQNSCYDVLEDLWWSEATAEWFAIRKDSQLIREKLTRLLSAPDKSLDDKEDIDRPYDASIFPLYLEQLDKKFIKDIWEYCITYDSCEAIDKVLSDRGGLKKVFEEFSLEHVIQKMPYYHISGKPDREVKKELINLSEGENIIKGRLPHLSARYYNFSGRFNITSIEGINRKNGGLYILQKQKNNEFKIINLFNSRMPKNGMKISEKNSSELLLIVVNSSVKPYSINYKIKIKPLKTSTLSGCAFTFLL
jgi:hypothetical protein